MKPYYSKRLNRYYLDNAWSFHTAFIVFAVGIAAGAFFLSYLNYEHLSILKESLVSYINNSEIATLEFFNRSFQLSMTLYLLTFLSGFINLGYFVSYSVLLFYGITLGFSVGLLVLLAGFKGILLAAAAVVPHNLLLAPALIFLAVGSVTFTATRKTNYNKADCSEYIFNMLILFIPVFLSILVKWAITPVFVSWITKIL